MKTLILIISVFFAGAAVAAEQSPWPPVDAPETLEFARVISVTWGAPTQRLNGAPLSVDELSHYELIVKDAAGQHSYRIANTATGADHIIAAVGDHCAVIRAIDTDGLASPWTEQACKMVSSGPGRMTLTIGG